MLIRGFKTCGSSLLVIFDEVQKVQPGTLDVLMPALEEQGTLHDFKDKSLLPNMQVRTFIGL